MELLKVEPFQETLNAGMCGPASLKMVLDYYGIKKTEEDLAGLCETDSELGTNVASLRKAAEGLGFDVEIKNESSFKDIQEWLNKDVPVIVSWLSGGRRDYDDSNVPDGHYSPVVGLDGSYICLQDPEIGKIRKVARNDFLRVWFDFDGAYIKSANDLMLRIIIAIYQTK